MPGAQESAGLTPDERRRLLGMAFRMLGTVADAEDAVQEAFLRWYRLEAGERATVANVPGWFTRVTSRVCLDMLGTARARRERYVGQWLPEPVPVDLFAGTAPSSGESLTAASPLDPLDRITMDDAVSTALLVVLDAMTPAERVAFVLHDVFAVPFPEIADIVGRSAAAVRQLATSARRHVATRRATPAAREDHAAVVHAFAAACAGGDLNALMAVLDPQVELRSDGGGYVSAARNPVYGTSNVARFVLGILAKRPGLELIEQPMPGGIGYEMRYGGRVVGVTTLRVSEGKIHEVWLQMNPEKLSRWTRDESPSDLLQR